MNYALQHRLNVPAKLLVFPDENHWILKGENSRYFYKEVHGWLVKLGRARNKQPRMLASARHPGLI
jgi:hypothetical protein